MKFHIGDEIKIINPGQVYPSYRDMATRLGATNWEYDRGYSSGAISRGMTGRINNIIDDKAGGRVYHLVRLSDGYDYVFDGEGLEVVRKASTKQYGIVKFLQGIEK